MKLKNGSLLCLMCALALISVTACGGSDKDKTSSSAKTEGTTAVSAVTDTAESVSAEETSSAEEQVSEAEKVPYQAGELLTETAKLFNGAYTYEISTSFSDQPDVVTERKFVCDGDQLYISVKDEGGETLGADIFYLAANGKMTGADNRLKAYSVSESAENYSLIKSIIDNETERTYTHIPEDTEGMTVEEYTYTGDTYISVYDFYFNEDGTLAKYTALYMEEGEEQLIQTTVVNKLEAVCEEGFFDGSMLEGYTDFDALTEDERLGFCQENCNKYGITTDDMNEFGIDTDEFKTIGFDKFVDLVDEYGKPAADEEKTSDSTDGKEKKDKDKEKQDSSVTEDSSKE